MTNLANLKRITDESTARTILAMIAGDLEPREVSPQAERYARDCYSEPWEAELILIAADDLLGTCGVEGWAREDGRSGVSYCNTGDSYKPTLFLLDSTRHGGTFRVSSFATIIEAIGGAS